MKIRFIKHPLHAKHFYIADYCLSTETLREVLFPLIDKHWGLEWVVSGVRIQTPLHIIHAVTTGHLVKAESLLSSLSDSIACAPHTLMTSYLSFLCVFPSPTWWSPFMTWPPPMSQASLQTIHQIQTHTQLCVIFWTGNSTLWLNSFQWLFFLPKHSEILYSYSIVLMCYSPCQDLPWPLHHQAIR